MKEELKEAIASGKKYVICENIFMKTYYIFNTETHAMLHGFRSPGDAEETIKFFIGEQE